MKRLKVMCCVYTCNVVLWTMDFNLDDPGYEEIETVGDSCHFCQEEDKKQKFVPVRFGQKSVGDNDDFRDMMAKRKLENRKASGKGAGRGNR